MRWMAQQVDYEMAGKDLTDSVRLSSAIVRALGGAAQGHDLRDVPWTAMARRSASRRAMA
jgi:hypothetical protein